MIAIILAAGTGARLGSRCASNPKPCVRVAGRPLLAYPIDFARAAGADTVIVVAGHIADKTEATARHLGADDVLANPRYAVTGNLQSLEVARRAGRLTGDVLVMNGDVILHPDIAAVVASTARKTDRVVAFIDQDRPLQTKDVKVRLDEEGSIIAIDKQLDSWDAGHVGVTFIPAARLDDFLLHADNVSRERGDGIPVEAVLHRMAAVDPATTVDVSGHGCVEVDEETDLAQAETLLARDPWYGAPRA